MIKTSIKQSALTLLSAVFAIVITAQTAAAQTLDSDPYIKMMTEELQYNMQHLKAKPVPA